MAVENQLTSHYTRGMLEEKILSALQRAGKNPANSSSDDLAALDNLHVGGREATESLAAFLQSRPGIRLLDVGSGLDGPTRHFAELGCDVTGLDLTEEFVPHGSRPNADVETR